MLIVLKKYFVIIFLSMWSLNAAYAEYAEVILLGTGTPRPSIERFGAATLVSAGGKYFLFDAGRGVTIRLNQAGITPDQIGHVFLTHLHSDHISGLDDLWITGWIWQRQHPIQVSGPAGTENLIDSLRNAYVSDIIYRTENTSLEDDQSQIESFEIDEGVVYDAHGVKITAFMVDHMPVVPAFGYRVDFGDRSIVISGDTTYSENLIRHAQYADLLVHEIADSNQSLLKKNKRLQSILAYHTTPSQMISILQHTQPRMTVLNHVLLFGVTPDEILKEITAGYKGRVKIGYDLMKISIGSEITTHSLQIN